jgi:hypothetical protein
MLPILQSLLCKDYPTLYQGFKEFECDSGWFGLIDTLSSLIVKRSSTAVIQQVKEKHGSLVISISGYAPQDYDYMFGVTTMTYWLSHLICERCARKGSIINSFGATARCELHDQRFSHHTEYDETADLPFPMNIKGTMWRLMILEFYELIQMHTKNNGMPTVNIHRVNKFKGKLCIEFTGGDDVTQGMAALLLAYAEKIDEETGERD